MKLIIITLGLTVFTAGVSLAADAKAGEAIYGRSCKTCHGADGSGNPAIAKMLKVDMKDLKSAEIQSKSDAELKKIITDGQGKMRPVTSVKGSSLDDVVAYIRSLKK